VDLIPDGLQYSWFYSDSEAATEIPNRVNVALEGQLGPGDRRDAQSGGAHRGGSGRLSLHGARRRGAGLWRRADAAACTSTSRTSSWPPASSTRARRAPTSRCSSRWVCSAFRTRPSRRLPLGEVFSDANITDPRNSFEICALGCQQRKLHRRHHDGCLVRVCRLDAAGHLATGRRRALGAVPAGGLDLNPFGFGVGRPVVTTDPDVLLSNVFNDDLPIRRLADVDQRRLLRGDVPAALRLQRDGDPAGPAGDHPGELRRPADQRPGVRQPRGDPGGADQLRHSRRVVLPQRRQLHNLAVLQGHRATRSSSSRRRPATPTSPARSSMPTRRSCTAWSSSG
jgi:hypothetical protein